MLSKKAKNIAPSATLEMNKKVRHLRSIGIDVVDFGLGEPDFDTPEHIKKAAINAIKKGVTKYTAPAGTEELRMAVCKKLKRENKLDYSTSQIAVSSGSKHSLYNIFLALLDRGDEVIIPMPYWTSYPEQVKLAGGVPVFVNTDDNFHIDVRSIEKTITKRTKAIIINSPNNPSGAVYDKNQLKALAGIAKENIFLVSDEIYEHFIYSGRHHSVAEFAKENTILVNGVSKAYAMTGWRIGYCAADEKIIRAVSDIQGQTTSNPSSISQMAALEALNKAPSKDMVNEFNKRRKYAVKRLADMGFKFKIPEGAFYVFPEVPNKTNSVKFSELLLDKARVAVVPGKDFGSDRHVRISYATAIKNIEEGMNRIENLFKKI